MSSTREDFRSQHPGNVTVVNQLTGKTRIVKATNLPFEGCFAQMQDGGFAVIECVLIMPQGEQVSVAKYAPGKRLLAVERMDPRKLPWPV